MSPFVRTLLILLGLTLGACGDTTMATRDSDAGIADDAGATDFDAGSADDAAADASPAAPGTWGAVLRAFDIGGIVARRAAWPSGFYVRRQGDGTYRSSSNGGSTYAGAWAPSAGDVDATDWLLFESSAP